MPTAIAGKVLVTGANGFVGSALLARLASALPGQVRGAARRWPADGTDGIQRVVVGDLGGDTDWAAALADVHTVVHTAARVHVMRERVVDPLTAYRAVNVEGTLALARQAAAVGVRRLIFLSTIKVNGEESAAGRPFRFDDPPRPSDPYGVSKLEAEDALREVARTTGLEVVCLRCPLVYGPGVGGNFKRMMAWVHRGVVLPLGSVDNRRSLVSIDNLAGLVFACVWHPYPLNGVLMVSDGEDLSTPQLLRKVAESLDRRAKLLPFPIQLLRFCAALVGRRAEAQRLCSSLQVDITATCERVDWSPSVAIDDALRATAAAWLAANQ